MVSVQKKRIIGVLFIVAVLLLAVIVPAGAAPLYGDCNDDGQVNSTDFSLFKRYLLETENTYQSHMDLNTDNKVNSIDFSIMKQYLLGIIESLPYGGTNPPEPGVLLVGRFDTSDPAGARSAWSGSSIKANFKGTGISATIRSMGDNWFNVIIDGTVKAPINVTAGSSAPITLASGLTNGNHSVELVRRTEAWVGDTQFLGFTVTGGSLLAPPAPSERRIEFIGDSITCGYGNEGESQYQSFTTKNENAYMAYGAITARLLEADPVTVCWSGKGVVRNYGGDTAGDLMPALYPQILPYDKNKLWDSSKWIPQVVVINLGTNDFSTGSPNKSSFTAAYSSFVDRIRSQYPNAHIYCAIGPMLSGNALSDVRDYLNTVVAQKSSSGDQRIHYIEFPVQEWANGYGEDWHPSIKTHQLMAEQLAAQIRKDLGW
ncbi:lysophospholipase L1-like esterase [Anaerobacterium chartisolvens]|uniref:Lysophospholipase L1-like esterase n=1 Tax=Anaerobacterium chartisolvens TaxID=1297424 RepID=A0A369B3K7_9FIRM|nr:GDSL-type esterase/lipase family protein [Anaerobacterium chartisolvens]RCX14294.1 lysophospholipase L1-like esterase [Anaerobacterium chartisolvens]